MNIDEEKGENEEKQFQIKFFTPPKVSTSSTTTKILTQTPKNQVLTLQQYVSRIFISGYGNLCNMFHPQDLVPESYMQNIKRNEKPNYLKTFFVCS